MFFLAPTKLAGPAPDKSRVKANEASGGGRAPVPDPRRQEERGIQARREAGPADGSRGRGEAVRRSGTRPGRFAELLAGVDRSPRGAAGRGVAEEGPLGVVARRSAGEEREAPILGVLRELGGQREQGAEGEPARRGPRDDATLDLAPFQPPPPALAVPPGHVAATAPATGGSAQAHAEAAALADRLVTSMRVGRVGKDGHEVRMKLALRRDAGLEVRLRLDGGRLTATLVGEPGHRAEATRLAEALEQELAARGLDLDSVEVE